jgi:hypothetical protein
MDITNIKFSPGSLEAHNRVLDVSFNQLEIAFLQAFPG